MKLFGFNVLYNKEKKLTKQKEELEKDQKNNYYCIRMRLIMSVFINLIKLLF